VVDLGTLVHDIDRRINAFLAQDAEGKDPVKEGWVGRAGETGEFTSKGEGSAPKVEIPVAKERPALKGSAKGSHPATIASRRPFAKRGPGENQYRRPDLAGMEEDPKSFATNMDLLREAKDYPNLRAAEVTGKTPEEVAHAAIEHAKLNLKYLYDHATPEIREHGAQWYEGAHNIAQAAAAKYGLPLQSAVGVYAALSPQKLWDMNVYLGDRVIDIYHTKQHEPWSGDLGTAMDKVVEAKVERARTAARQRAQKAKLNQRVTNSRMKFAEKRVRQMFRPLQGKTLADLKTPLDKGLWIAAYDEASGPMQFDRLSSEGEKLGLYQTKGGKPYRAVWQQSSAMENAILALESGGDRKVLSDAMGTQHKVRSFYNNILDPNSDNDDATMDTHAVGAALFRALGSGSDVVAHSLGMGAGESSSDKTGSSGLYGLWNEAYAELAHDLKIKPRVLQSIVWETKRRLFDEDMPKVNKALIEQAWQDYHIGKQDLGETQDKIWTLAGGIVGKRLSGTPAAKKEAPSSGQARRQRPRQAHAPARDTGNPRELHRVQLDGQRAGGVDLRGRGSNPRGTAGLVAGLDRGIASFFARDEFKESEHPRDEEGKFAETGVEGLPEGSKLPKALGDMSASGRYKLTATKGEKRQFQMGDRYSVVVEAKAPEGIKTVGEGRRAEKYDPELAEPFTLNPDDPEIRREVARLKPGLTEYLSDVLKTNPEHMYRGMSAEEMDFIKDKGLVQSRGAYNIGEQQVGLTYWSSDVDQAETYASDFAPPEYKASFNKPAYMVVAKRAGPEDIVKVEGTGKNELGVNRAVDKEDIIEIWRGRAAIVHNGEYEVQERNGDLVQLGSNAPGTTVVWEKVPKSELGLDAALDAAINAFFTQDAWKEEQHPRKKTGQFARKGEGEAPAEAGTGVTVSPSYEIDEQAVKDKTHELAGEMQVDPGLFDYSPQLENFMLGGTMREEAAHYDPADGRITFRTRSMDPRTAKGTAAHEIQHLKFDEVRKRQRAELHAIQMREAAGEKILDDEGHVKEEHYDEYPVAAMMSYVYANPEIRDILRKADGVSDYSRDYWKAEANNEVPFSIAVDETLAEIARGDYMEWGAKVDAASPVWQQLYTGVNTLYDHVKTHPGPDLDKAWRGEHPVATNTFEDLMKRMDEQIEQQHKAGIRKEIDAVAKQLDFDPAKIEMSDDEYKFELGGETKTAAAVFHTVGPQAGTVTVYTKHVDPETIKGVVAHETQHAKWHMVMDEYAKEISAILDVHAPGSQIDLTDYPTYAALQMLTDPESQEELRKTDGVTDYSKEWWKAAEDGTADVKTAVDETLAEMAYATMPDTEPRQGAVPAAPIWQKLFDTSNMLYERLSKPHKPPNLMQRIKDKLAA
jgi:hypothetical protein